MAKIKQTKKGLTIRSAGKDVAQTELLDIKD